MCLCPPFIFGHYVNDTYDQRRNNLVSRRSDSGDRIERMKIHVDINNKGRWLLTTDEYAV